MSTPVFVWVPDQGLTNQPKLAVNKASFGDGYEQRSVDGLNSIKDMWNLSFTNRTKTEINAIESFVRSLNGVRYFEWTSQRGLGRFKCETWSTSYNHDGDATASLTFEQVFDV